MKDWTGNKKTTFAQLGASNHSDTEREVNDFYSTDPNTVKILLNALKRDKLDLHDTIWECACGQGYISKVLESNYKVISTDLVNRGYGGGIGLLVWKNTSRTKRNKVRHTY